MSTPPDEDLRDVFRLLYADDDADDWAFSDDEDTSPTSATAGDDESGDLLASYSASYTRKRFRNELDSLFLPSKKARVFPSPQSPSQSFILSSTPLALPDVSVYAPYAPLSLLARCRPYGQHSFLEMEAPLNSTSLARGGWAAVGRYDIACVSCAGRVSLKGVEEIKEGPVRREVVKRLGRGIRGKHRSGCPWKIKDCPDDLAERLRKMVHPIVASSLGLLATRLEAECSGDTVKWTSPLTNPEVRSLQANLARHVDPVALFSDFATAAAWFGWFPYYPHSALYIDIAQKPVSTDMVSCRACERRIGLWAFKTSTDLLDPADPTEKRFDMLDEHFGWCPIKNGTWWAGSGLLRDRSELPVVDGEEVSTRGWLKVSEKMEKKPWRRAIRG